jgi:hypothetical protein
VFGQETEVFWLPCRSAGPVFELKLLLFTAELPDFKVKWSVCRLYMSPVKTKRSMPEAFLRKDEK